VGEGLGVRVTSPRFLGEGLGVRVASPRFVGELGFFTRWGKIAFYQFNSLNENC